MPHLRLWRYRRSRLIAAALLLLAFVVVAAFEAETYYVRDQLAEAAYGWKPHRVPCEEWPTPAEVAEAIDRNADHRHADRVGKPRGRHGRAQHD